MGGVELVDFVGGGEVFVGDGVVCDHGGYGSLTEALGRGLPVLSLRSHRSTIGSTQPGLVKLGAGLALEQEKRTADAIQQSVQRLLNEREHRDRAREIAEEIASLTPVDHAPELLERLGARTD